MSQLLTAGFVYKYYFLRKNFNMVLTLPSTIINKQMLAVYRRRWPWNAGDDTTMNHRTRFQCV